MLSRSVILDLTYNALLNHVGMIQQQRNLTNDEIEGLLIRILHDVQAAKILESANTILKLTKQVEELEEKGGKNDKPDNQP